MNKQTLQSRYDAFVETRAGLVFVIAVMVTMLLSILSLVRSEP